MGYSLENACRYKWSSVSGNFNPERVSHLENYLIGESILDAGCGGGGYVNLLTGSGLKVTGIDLHWDFLIHARRTGNKGDFLQSNILELPFPNKQFDCTFCYDVLEHVDDFAAIRELARVTSKRLILAVPKEDENFGYQFGVTFYPYQDRTHLRYYSELLVRELADSIDNVSVKIIPELPIDTKNLIRATVEFDLDNIFPFEFKFLKMKYFLKELITHRRIRIDRELIHKKAYEFLTRKLLEDAKYLHVFTGFLAVIDL